MNIFCAVRNRRENAWDYSKNHGAILGTSDYLSSQWDEHEAPETTDNVQNRNLKRHVQRKRKLTQLIRPIV